MVSDDHAQQTAGERPADGLLPPPQKEGRSTSPVSAESVGRSTPMNPSEQPVIVIIDDDDAVRESLRMLLECYGYVVRDHASASSFLDSDIGKAGLLLIDQHMPVMTGIELLELLHAKRHPAPALMMTGRTDLAIEARLARIGVKLLHKPVAEDQLIVLIAEALRPGAARRGLSATASD